MFAQEGQASEQLQRREVLQANLGTVDEGDVQPGQARFHALEIGEAQPRAVVAHLQVLDVGETRALDRDLGRRERGTLPGGPARQDLDSDRIGDPASHR